MTAGDVVTLSGVVSDQLPCAGSASVSLYRQTFGTAGFERIASGLDVDATGRWEHEVAARHNATYVATPDATSTCEPVSSDPAVVRARVKIAARVLRYCDLLHRVEGRMTPPHPGTNVYLGERVAGRWYRRDGDRVGGRGRFELVTPRCSGRFRVLWPKQSPANDRGTKRLNP